MNRTRGSSQGLLRSTVSPPESPLPPVSPEGKAKVDMLIVQVGALDLYDDSRLVQRQLSALREACSLACSDSDTLRYAVERLHRACLKNRAMCAKFAAMSNDVGLLEVGGVKFRTVLLNCLQEDFRKHQQMQADVPEQFLNAAALLGEVFSRVRTSTNNSPITVLSIPVLEYLGVLLTGDEPEIELFAYLVSLCGQDLRTVAVEEFHKLHLKVRATLMSRNLSSQCRLWLLFIMDTANRYMNVEPSQIDEFYLEHLGKGTEQLHHLVKSTKQAVVGEDASNNLEDNKATSLLEKVSQITVSSKDTSSDMQEKRFQRDQCPPQHSNSDKRERFRAAINNGDIGKNKHYLHDDRFEKDDGVYFKPPPNITKPTACPSNWKQPSVDRSGRETYLPKTLKEPPSNNSNGVRENLRKNPSSYTQSFVSRSGSRAQKEEEENWDE